jgi:preprotein translocase subunit SecA
LNAKYHAKEAEIITEAGREGAVTIATNMAGRGTDIKLSPAVKENGGLVIIGTERHESRRIDLQLRGRAGRQGDPGDSYFYVSLEDDLMRMFGSDRIASVMDRLGIQEGEVIQHSMVTNSIQRAQKKVEENNFGVRKRLLEYDNVMNAQREIIYKRRKNALFQEELEIDIIDMFEHIGQIIAEKVKAENDPDVLQYLMVHKVAIVDFIQSKADLQRISVQKLTEKITKKLEYTYIERKNRLGQFVYTLFEKQDAKQLKHVPEQVLMPFTDGTKGVQISVNIQKIIDSKGDQAIKDLEQMIMISTIDFQWKEHLRLMDELRNSVQMAVHEQKDPLLMYKFQGFEAFNTLMYSIYESVCGFMMSAKIPLEKH